MTQILGRPCLILCKIAYLTLLFLLFFLYPYACSYISLYVLHPYIIFITLGFYLVWLFFILFMMFYNINLLTFFLRFSFGFLFSFIWFIVSCHDREDRVIEGTKKNMCMILIANIGRELCPSAITEFLHRHTSVSASVFIFPNLASEVYSRGAIMLDSEKEFQKLCDFLNNPNCIVISSTERYFVCIFLKYVGCSINFKHSLLWLFIVGSTVKSKRLC